MFLNPEHETRGDFLTYVLDKMLNEMDHLTGQVADQQRQIMIKPTEECQARLYTDLSVKFWTVNAVANAYPRCADVMTYRAASDKPHVCDTVRYDKEAIGFMKVCPFYPPATSGVDRPTLCKQQIMRLIEKEQLMLPGVRPDDYTVGGEYETDPDSAAASVKPVGSKLFGEVRDFGLQTMIIVNEIGENCLMNTPGKPLGDKKPPTKSQMEAPCTAMNILGQQSTCIMQFTAEYMCSDILHCS